MSTPDQLARQFMRDLEVGNTDVLRRMTEALARSLPSLTAQAEAAAERVTSLKAEGKNAEAATYARTRAGVIAQQVETEVRRLVAQLRPELLNGQAAAVEAGLQAAERLTAAAMGLESLSEAGLTWQRAPLEAVQALVGSMAEGGPLPELLNQIAPDTARRVQESLTTGMLAGKHPRQIARALRQEVGLSQVRAETIARTEQLRAYRTASLRSYEQNRDIVPRFRRMAALSPRTCPACLALHNTIQDTGELFASHPNDRCSVVPLPKTFRELGIDLDEPPRTEPESGDAWLSRQPAAVQEQVLGKGGAKAYRDGVPLARFAKVHDDAVWGPTVSNTPLRELVA